MFTVYTTTIVKASIHERHNFIFTKGRVNSQFAITSLFLILLFAIGIPVLILVRVASFIRTSDLVLFLGLVETAFAVYLGMIIDELYGKKSNSNKN